MKSELEPKREELLLATQSQLDSGISFDLLIKYMNLAFYILYTECIMLLLLLLCYYFPQNLIYVSSMCIWIILLNKFDWFDGTISSLSFFFSSTQYIILLIIYVYYISCNEKDGKACLYYWYDLSWLRLLQFHSYSIGSKFTLCLRSLCLIRF